MVTRKMARPEGFEPPTNGFGSQYSIQLSYGRVFVEFSVPCTPGNEFKPFSMLCAPGGR